MSPKSKRRFSNESRVPQFRHVEKSPPPVAALLWVLLVVVAVMIILAIIGVQSRMQQQEHTSVHERSVKVTP